MDKSVNENNLYQQMIRFAVRAKRHLIVTCEDKHLTPVQGVVLLLLETEKPRSMNALADEMGCDASNITGLIDRLEAHELITRSSCDKDRRIKLLSLTKKGQKCRSDVLANIKDQQALDFSKLSTDESKELTRLIHKVLA